MRTVLAGVLAGMLGLGVLAAHVRIDDAAPSHRGVESLAYLPAPAVARAMSAGYTLLTADYYWLKVIQYFSDRDEEQRGHPLLYPLLDLIVSLDPLFEYAYVFAGAITPPGGRDVSGPNHVLAKGVRELPRSWRIPFFLGFNLFYYEGRYLEAAQAMEAAAMRPGAPPYLAGIATRLYAEANEPELAETFLAEALAREPPGEVRTLLERRLGEVVADRNLRVAPQETRFENGRRAARGESWG